MLTIEFEDRVHRKFLHTGEADLALVQVALNRLAATSGKPAESLRFPSEPNVYLIPTPSDLRIVVRYEPQRSSLRTSYPNASSTGSGRP